MQEISQKKPEPQPPDVANAVRILCDAFLPFLQRQECRQKAEPVAVPEPVE